MRWVEDMELKATAVEVDGSQRVVNTTLQKVHVSTRVEVVLGRSRGQE